MTNEHSGPIGQDDSEWEEYNQQRGSSDQRVVPSTALQVQSGYVFTPEGRDKAKARFLDAVRIWGTVRRACLESGINRGTYAYWRSQDAVFDAEYRSALEDYNDKLREEIDRRATEGTVKLKKVYFQGELVDSYEEREYSDALLLAQAKAKMPEYREGNRNEGDSSDKIPLAAVRRILEEADAAELKEAGMTLTPQVPQRDVVDAEYAVKPSNDSPS